MVLDWSRAPERNQRRTIVVLLQLSALYLSDFATASIGRIP